MKKIICVLLFLCISFSLAGCSDVLDGAFYPYYESNIAKEIASYNSPDGEYSLVFEQMGDPEWPFGATDVRLTLKGNNGEIIERVSTQLQDDGASARKYNIASISWNDDAVIVILRASEMEDKEVSIAYSKS